MPPRLSKRQQRELEEIEALGGPSKTSDADSAEDEAPIGRSNPFSFGATTFISHEDEDDVNDSETPTKKLKKPKRKKKKAAAEGTKSQNDNEEHVAPTPVPEPATTPVKPQIEPQVTMTASERKALKKAKQKEKKVKEDDLDQALAELSIQLPKQEGSSQANSKGQTLADFLSVSLQYLDAEAELRKFFGSRVVQATKTKSSTPSRRNAGALRSNLTRPQSSWWSATQREGLSIRPLTDEEVKLKLKRRDWTADDDEKWWTVEYSKKYKSVSRAFMRIVQSGDPQALFEVLRLLPWHADTLLQTSDVYRHREEYSQAADFIDRALFTYERCFIGAFTFTSGLNRLEFDRVENRPFFLALHRQVIDLQRRGCVRTAFEFARLLFSLDPWSDPHGAALHLEHVSIKANMAQWFVDMYDFFNKKPVHPFSNARLNPSTLPGWTYSRALALRILEKDGDHSTSTTALSEAVRDFPSIVPLLADKLEVSLPATVRSHPSCRIETDGLELPDVDAALHMLSHLYAQRSFQLWKDHSSWFAETVATAFASFPPVALPNTKRHEDFRHLTAGLNILYSFFRHVLIIATDTSYRGLMSFFPRYTFRENALLTCDPIPPKNAVSIYDDSFFDGTEDLFAHRPRTQRERERDRRILAQMVPDPGFRQQLEGFFDAHGLEQRFRGGVVQFAQALARLPPQAVEDIMVNGIAALDQAERMNPQAPRQGGMPGGMPDQNVVEMDLIRMLMGPQPELQEEENVRGDGDNDVQNQEENREDEQEDDDEDGDGDDGEDNIVPMPSFIANIFGRLFGRARVEESSSSESEVEGEGEDEDERNRDLNAVD